MLEEISEKVEKLLMPLLNEWSLELFELRIKQQGETLIIQILIDRHNGGITIDECSKINKRLLEKLEKQQEIDDDCVVEVSSPGLDRPLKTKKEFLRVLGQRAHFYLCDTIQQRKQYDGIIKEVIDNSILIDPIIKKKFSKVKNEESQELIIPIDKIQKAVIIF